MKILYSSILSFLLTLTASSQGLNYVTGSSGPGTNYYNLQITTDASDNIIVAGAVDAASGSSIYIQKWSNSGSTAWTKTIAGTNFGCCDYIYNKGMVEKNGYIYITGNFLLNVDFDPSANSSTLTANGYDAFVAKYNTSGELIWVKQMGGIGNQEGLSIAVDANENVYIAGANSGTIDLDPGANTVSETNANSNADAFFVKLTSAGDYVSSAIIEETTVNKLYYSSTDKIISTGYFISTVDFDPGANTTSKTSNGSADAFVLELSNTLAFSNVMVFGSTGPDKGNDLLLHANGNITIGLEYSNTIDVDPGANTTNLTSTGGLDVLIIQLNSSYSYLWNNTFGGTANDLPKTLLELSDGRIAIGGSIKDNVDFDPGTGTNLYSAGTYDNGFIWILTSSGLYSEGYGFGDASTSSIFTDLTTDNGNNIWGIGTLYGTINFDKDGGTNNLTGYGADYFLVKWGLTTNNIISGNTPENWNVFPNPSSQYISIPNQTGTLTIIDAIGQQSTETIMNEKIDVSEYKPGVYTIKNSLGQTGRFIKQ